MNSKDIISVQSKMSDYNQGHIIIIDFNDTGKEKFFEITKKLENKALAISVNSKMVSCPMIIQAMNSDETVISGNFSAEKVEEMASQIREGIGWETLNIIESSVR
jgi:preprotein translocase subunit SecD